jgi:2-oxoglutarate ferredoxin oxidoreductase subunit alpha
MSEFIGLAYYAEVPTVIFDVQRAGPSTGMPTRTQQGDLMLAAYASHGDTKHIVLFPGDPEECFHFAVAAFDLAERYQTPVFVLSDLDIGMNDWMCRRFRWDDSYRADRGKVLGPAELDKVKAFHRYLDVDGDGIAARTLPGVHPKAGYFARGSGHNKLGGYTEDPAEYREVVDRIARKIDGAAAAVPAPSERRAGSQTPFGLITIGSCNGAALEAVDQLAARGRRVDYLRVRGFPFADSVRKFIDDHELVFVVEQNRDAQLRTLLQIDLEVGPEKLRSITNYGGFPMSAQYIVPHVMEMTS